MRTKYEQAIGTIIRSVNEAAERRRAYDADPHYRREDQDRERARIAADREAAVARAGKDLVQESKEIERTYARIRRKTFDPVETESSWRRISAMLDAGLGAEDVARQPGFSRTDAEAIRRNIRAYLTVAMRGGQPDEVEAAATRVDRFVETAELELMEPTERYATEAERERRLIEEVVAPGLLKYLAAVRAGGASAQDTLELGHALSEAGYSPAPASEDPERAAERARNSLPPPIRDALNQNVTTGLSRSPDTGSFGG